MSKKTLYCPHGIFHDHCHYCIDQAHKEEVANLKAQLKACRVLEHCLPILIQGLKKAPQGYSTLLEWDRARAAMEKV